MDFTWHFFVNAAHVHVQKATDTRIYYGVAMISKLLKNVGPLAEYSLFHRALVPKRPMFFRETTNRSYPILQK